jgi:cobalamin biosynthesis protein CobD/CbiB
LSSTLVPLAISHIAPLQSFAQTHSVNLDVSLGFGVVFLLSLIGCIAGTLLSEPQDVEILKDFYRRVRPWGFWGPILNAVQREDPSFRRNQDFWRDMFNIVVGMVWQIALVALPMYLVTWKLDSAAIAAVVVAIASLVLKFSWYDHLKELEHINQYSEPGVAKELTAAH